MHGGEWLAEVALNWLDGQYPGVTQNLGLGLGSDSGTWTFIKVVGNLEEQLQVSSYLQGITILSIRSK